MVIILIVMLIAMLFLGIKLYQTKKQLKIEEAFSQTQERLANATKAFQDLGRQYEELSISMEQLGVALRSKQEEYNGLSQLVAKEDELLQEKRNKAVELAKQDAELVKAKYQQQLNE